MAVAKSRHLRRRTYLSSDVRARHLCLIPTLSLPVSQRDWCRVQITRLKLWYRAAVTVINYRPSLSLGSYTKLRHAPYRHFRDTAGLAQQWQFAKSGLPAIVLPNTGGRVTALVAPCVAVRAWPLSPFSTLVDFQVPQPETTGQVSLWNFLCPSDFVSLAPSGGLDLPLISLYNTLYAEYVIRMFLWRFQVESIDEETDLAWLERCARLPTPLWKQEETAGVIYSSWFSTQQAHTPSPAAPGFNYREAYDKVAAFSKRAFDAVMRTPINQWLLRFDNQLLSYIHQLNAWLLVLQRSPTVDREYLLTCGLLCILRLKRFTSRLWHQAYLPTAVKAKAANHSAVSSALVESPGSLLATTCWNSYP